MGPGEGGSKKFLWPGGYFTNKSWSIFFYWGGDFGKNGSPGGVKKFSAAFGGQKFTTPLGPGSNVVRGWFAKNFVLRGVVPPPTIPPLPMYVRTSSIDFKTIGVKCWYFRGVAISEAR